MKYQKELRWLVLMLLPFVFMLGVHLGMPLLIVFNSLPTAASAYVLAKTDPSENEARSMHMLVTSALQHTINKYFRFIDIFSEHLLADNNNTFLDYSTPINPINSAF